MNFNIIFLVAFLLGTAAAFSASHNSKNGKTNNAEAAAAAVDRRGALAELTAAAAAAVAGSALVVAPGGANADETGGGAEDFVGTYSDPNHPGGKRTVKLLDKKVGDYQLAEVYGGGGRGEPESYVLPAVVIGGRSIVIDFSPKGGPRDFAGVLYKGTDIKFLRDGNIWPRIS